MLLIILGSDVGGSGYTGFHTNTCSQNLSKGKTTYLLWMRLTGCMMAKQNRDTSGFVQIWPVVGVEVQGG